MRTLLLAVVASMVASLLAVAGPAAGAGNGYVMFLACSAKANARPATECALSDTKAAFFRSNRHDATYRVCVQLPHKKRRLCAGAQEAEKGETRVVTIATSLLGRHVVTWYVAGVVVGRRVLRVVEG